MDTFEKLETLSKIQRGTPSQRAQRNNKSSNVKKVDPALIRKAQKLYECARGVKQAIRDGNHTKIGRRLRDALEISKELHLHHTTSRQTVLVDRTPGS
jgi:hypothetical protein